jgi:hypothetical protein
MSSPIRYIGGEVANIDYHHGQLRPLGGVAHYQVLRANRSHPEQAEDFGWTYNHAPMLAYWKGRFHLEYLSDPVGEHEPPGHTLLTRSSDGIHWEKPRVIFPVYTVPAGVHPEMPAGGQAVMHQRMGFHVASDGRLLALGFYGLLPAPNNGKGIGRVVREVYEDGTRGPIYFLRYNRHAGWDETNTQYPCYATSPDTGFVQACEALLANKLVTLQWWEEDRSPDGFYAVEGYKALSAYHLPDGRVVGLWKWSKAALSDDEGRTWSPVMDAPSLIMGGAKIWGQRTPDGRYALVYNPSPDDGHRWPLAALSSADGLTFDHLRLVNGRVSPRRYAGQYKDLGLNYVRGISEGDGIPPGDAFWVTYSMNKEDIWVSRIPVPLRDTVDEPVNDVFADFPAGGYVPEWAIHSGLWTSVNIVDNSPSGERFLRLTDRDPYESAQAERIFPESRIATVSFRLQARQTEHGMLAIELLSPRGAAAVQIALRDDGHIWARSVCHWQAVGHYCAHAVCDITLIADATRQRYRLLIDRQPALEEGTFARAVSTLHRITFRTGPANVEPTPETDHHAGADLPGADTPVPQATYDLHWLRTEHAIGEKL